MENICAVVLSCFENEQSAPMTEAQILFKPVAVWTAEAIRKSGIEDICIAGTIKSKEFKSEGIKVFSAEKKLNAGEALALAKDFINEHKDKAIMIISASVPSILEDSLKSAVKYHKDFGATAALTVYQEGDNESGAVIGVIAKAAQIMKNIDKAETISDLVNKAHKISIVCKRLRNSAGVKALSDMLREKILEKHILGGVYIPCADGVIIGPDVKIEAGTTILPGTIINGKSEIGKDCFIGPNSFVADSLIGDKVIFKSSFTEKSAVGDGTYVGPFSNLRANTSIGKNVKIGDFVEVKNSNVGDKTSIAHLTYVGDSDVGKNVNFGCGSVTVNYDGKNKHRTTIGDNVFIGCNTNFIAPVKVFSNTYIAAGSTITNDVPENALAIARSRQIIKENWVTKREGREV